ncbi:restriction endonuclease [Metabacillus litoralis]|uniref:Restriction endonuclease n=1 Tax=Metabacillus litoralis TaxID=152268 RepID=A0A5C6W9V7_9BACI|nr:restriction endonuclease [Metabacillus litoralis]TXC92639.1 restriction endonuclease [Metabacillus litoralis]
MGVSFIDLPNSDLIVDELYLAGGSGNLSDEVLSKLMYVENSGGFRARGNKKNFDLKYVVLFTTGEDIDWIDEIDIENGKFTYFGDNKKPGRELHDHRNKKMGNIILRECFNRLHSGDRSEIPPFFIFSKETGRNVRFRGLAIPGYEGMTANEDLVAIWSIKEGGRFQNYKSIFTILDVSSISREWIKDLLNDNGLMSKHAPKVWKDWKIHGIYKPLKAIKSTVYRRKQEQIPISKNDLEIIETIYYYFKTGQAFEPCAGQIAQLMDSNIINYDVTRATRDGGRDIVGKYRIGLESSSILVDFALEAKRYALGSGVGVKETSRLISRLRHRQFGILVTTSYVDEYTYKEIVEDQHPIVIISAIEIVSILKRSGYRSKETVLKWLQANFNR